MNGRVREIAYFLSSQHFSNGLRTTLSILLPSLLLDQFGALATGIVVSLGSLAVSLSDAPGPVHHRRNAMLATVLASILMTLITGFARQHPITMALSIGLFGFLFSLLVVYGNRATSVGTAALLTMILMLNRPLDPAGVLRESLLIGTGGLFYTAVSLLSSHLRPYQAARQALGQCIHEVARLMTIKADFYDARTLLDDDYRRLVAQQVVVSEQQDAVRELLFKNRQVMTASDETSRLLIVTFTDVVDLYEQIAALYYDYSAILERFGGTDILNTIAGLIRRQAAELDAIGLSVQTPLSSHRPVDFTPDLEKLWYAIDALSSPTVNTLILRKILVNLRTINQRLANLRANFSQPPEMSRTNPTDYGRFVSHQIITFSLLRSNLTIRSSAFRHAVRVALALLSGFVLAQLMPYGDHSHWILLTILVILKPAFSLTKQRNTERITGTFFGGLVGVLILRFIPDKATQFVFLVLLMLGTYSAQRSNYRVMVFCLTPFVLILFNFLGVGYMDLIEERLFDTVVGGLIALGTGYLLFPNWESHQIVQTVHEVLTANIRYLSLLADGLSGNAIQMVDYRLARKDVYVTSANLAAAFERMSSEPRRTQRDSALIYEFVVLNYVLSANTATLISGMITSDWKGRSPVLARSAKRALAILTTSLQQFDSAELEPVAAPATPSPEPLPPDTSPAPDESIAEQINFVQQVSSDIAGVVAKANWHV